MLTTATPGEQLLSIDKRGESPLKEEPYPILVGTAMTTELVNPETTLGSAPSIPATTISTSEEVRES